MPFHQNQTAIVIKTHNAKDADKVIHLILEDGSRKVVFAKGLKKSTSRKAHAIDLLNMTNLKFTKGKGGLDIITEAKLIDDSRILKSSYSGLMFIQAVCEVVDLFIQEEYSEPGYYKNLENLLTLSQPINLSLILAALILRFIYLSGDLPKLNEDVHSGDQIIESDQHYPTDTIGYTKSRDLSVGSAISDRIFKTQRFILKRDFPTIQMVGLTPSEQDEMLSLHINWLQLLVDKKLPACEMFISSVKSSNY